MAFDILPNCYEILDHPDVGRIEGIERCPGVIQYLGVQYATLKNAFSRGELATYPSDQGPDSRLGGILDARKHGYGTRFLLTVAMELFQISHYHHC